MHGTFIGQQGFSLVESIVIISIISILTLLVTTGLPQVRRNYQLRTDVEVVRLAISSARYHALNQIRPKDCIALIGNDETMQKKCSRAGVEIKQGEATTFIDIDENYTLGQRDIIVSRQDLFSVIDNGVTTFVFEPTPPTVVMYRNGSITSSGSTIELSFKLDNLKKTVKVETYGNVEEK